MNLQNRPRPRNSRPRNRPRPSEASEHDQSHSEQHIRAAIIEQARRIASTYRAADSTDPITSSIEREIALVLGHIDRAGTLQEDLEHRLLQSECYIGSELLQMEVRTPRYSPTRFPEREKLQRRLLNIEQERRRLLVQRERPLQELHDRLLSLLNKHQQLSP